MPTLAVQSIETASRRKKFFEFLFDRTRDNYVCVARRKPAGKFEERFFKWPTDETALLQYIEGGIIGYNLWFCPMAFDRPNRSKFDVSLCPAIWADLDACPPESLLVPPTLLIETSHGRHQGLWCIDEVVEPGDAEELSRAIAYYHADEGADKSGWDLTQLLRVPFSLNYKYDPVALVHLVAAAEVVSLKTMRDAYPVEVDDEGALWPFPEDVPEAQGLMQQFRETLSSRVWRLIQVPPDKDWSRSLWALELELCESGLSREQVFSIAKAAACNKYQRDGRNDNLLWREVCKAWAKHAERQQVVTDTGLFKTPDLLSEEDIKSVNEDKTFIDDYIDWAKSVGDAAEVYHHAGAFVCLSALMSGSVNLPTSFGTIIPNLWFLLLADTTLTRKSTALDLAVDMLTELDSSLIMATDGSIEGMFTALSLRPGQPSIFLRDEFSGLIEMMTKRDYYAGMGETLTKMYDGKLQKRVLRREVIEVRDPILIVFAGGIRTKILSLLNMEQVTSGFLPRFIFIAGQSDISKLRPLGPPVDEITTGRERLMDQLMAFRSKYQRMQTLQVGDQQLQTRNVQRATLTGDAWALYNEMERKLLETGTQNTSPELLTPVMDRLAKSGLKASVLIAASRMPEGNVMIEERDVMKAFSYVIHWRGFAMDVVSNIGLGQQERLIMTVYNRIQTYPGIMRSALMQTYHLDKRTADSIFDTLEQRGVINRTKSGRTETFSPTDL